MKPLARAVVFAYHNVGVRCLRVLLAHGFDVPLVVTHEPDPQEHRWFGLVADVARDERIECIAPDDPNDASTVSGVVAVQPDFIFSFYYRQMLGAQLLGIPARGALNMHGSLLPHFRGRAPVNWAVLQGATRTGATLHYMVEKPDAGDIVAQQAVPILPNDTAGEVFGKVTTAAEIALDSAIEGLIAGTAPRIPQDLAAGGYYRGRRPEDGRIDWSADAARIHNLVRAVAPPFPGALTTVGGHPARVLQTRVLDATGAPQRPTLRAYGNMLLAHAGGGGTLRVVDLEIDGELVDARRFQQRFGFSELVLPS